MDLFGLDIETTVKIVGGIGSAGGIIYKYRKTIAWMLLSRGQKPLIVNEAKVFLDIENEGKLAHYTHRKNIKITSGGEKDWHEHVYGEAGGTEIKNASAKVDDMPLATKLDPKSGKGRWHFDIPFGKAPEYGDIINTEISCDVTNSYTKNTEYWALSAFYPIRKFTLIITAPPGSNFSNGRIFNIIRDYQEYPLNKKKYNASFEITQSGNRPCIIFRLKNITLNEQIKFYWDWTLAKEPESK